jgi:hypothetical protein
MVLRRFAEYHDLEGAFGRRALTERATRSGRGPPHSGTAHDRMELAGLEPATSWVRYGDAVASV